jgi:Zn-dependent M28 family amino/carboxypeptidase
MGAAFVQAPPKRTVLVIAFTAEEKGLLGSKQYVKRPTVPLKQIVADVNVEMIGRPAAAGPGAMWVTGYERSSFGPIFALAAAPAGVKTIPDPYAMMGFFRRSDNYSFAAEGIPAHTCSSYNPRAGRYYHQPNDHAADCDFANMAVVVHGIYLGARAIAMGDATPQWVEGDPLAKKG